MARFKSLAPFLTPPSDSVLLGTWGELGGDEIPASLPGWDVATELMIRSDLQVDVASLRDACGLGNGFRLGVFVVLSSKAKQAMVQTIGQISESCDHVQISVSVPGARVAGELDIRTCLTVDYPGNQPTELCAARSGSILWEGLTRVVLEGKGPRMPLEVVDFSDLANLPERAAWWIRLELDDLDTPYESAIRIFINKSWEGAADMLSTGTVNGSADVFHALLHCDLNRTLVTQSLSSEEFVARADVPPGVSEATAFADDSVGSALLKTIRAIFPDEEIEQLRERLEDQPSALEAAIQESTLTLPQHLGALAQ